MNALAGIIALLVFLIVGYFAYSFGTAAQGGGGGGGGSGGGSGGSGGGQPCNVWQAYSPNAGQPPVWASNMPGCPSGACLTPGVAVTLAEDVCMGGGGTGSQADTGNIYGSNCPAAAATGQVAYDNDSALYYINRNPACGPWQTTTDPGAAFAFQGVPVCFPSAQASGVLAPYASGACTSADGFGADWILLADDSVPGS